MLFILLEVYKCYICYFFEEFCMFLKMKCRVIYLLSEGYVFDIGIWGRMKSRSNRGWSIKWVIYFILSFYIYVGLLF